MTVWSGSRESELRGGALDVERASWRALTGGASRAEAPSAGRAALGAEIGYMWRGRRGIELSFL